jgi:hypothetical protein
MTFFSRSPLRSLPTNGNRLQIDPGGAKLEVQEVQLSTREVSMANSPGEMTYHPCDRYYCLNVERSSNGQYTL